MHIVDIDMLTAPDELEAGGLDEPILDPQALEAFVQVDYTDERPAKPSNSTDLVRVYLQEIGRVPLLGRDEEVELAQQVQRLMKLMGIKESLGAQASDADWAEAAHLGVSELKRQVQAGTRAKKKMIEANLRLVVSVAKKYQNRGLELLDLVQEGTLGLERAVEKFDPTKGYRFSTYAYWWIRQGITRAIATQSRTIRLPVHITEKLNRIKKTQRKLSQNLGRTPTISEIADELEMEPAHVRELMSRVPRSVSLETRVGKDKDTELGELLEAEEVSPEESAVQQSLRRDVQELLGDLTLRERDVVTMRYGLLDGRQYSLSEIGRALELSRERVRQIESKALQKLRQPRRRAKVRDYLELME
ncbi:RNA polymerase sigma factor, RpoD/SigA family [Gloeobacter kilaueensis]|uniref:RNA polymerase sigma factor n=1 Tax=Gloeobacter kilaueensis (strain ATCC BAA-2537 / CCAP 1431/1 / ULC 316 / JS1) TaxID=1183438 RepID=U5QG87_GLOK1|nr:RNA polymerase sigma factor, RpoD/SigA family [Gloeobacter kilaueensis]AGY57873.1 RNA polymerase sigma factor SigC [Gloeobacter kilaueensis JS1]